MVNWFAVHGTSMNNTNHYISGDNKGYAEQVRRCTTEWPLQLVLPKLPRWPRCS